MEFMREFPDDASCLDYLWRTRYAEDAEHALCPKCEQVRSFKKYETKQSRQSWTCTACGHHVHPTAGTIFHKSSTSLHLWFYAIYLVSSSRCGIAAKQLERELGVNYKTALRMLHLIRADLMSQDNEPLSGEVEVDETFFGGRPHTYPKQPKNVHWDKKSIVVGAVERKGRIKAAVIPTSRPTHLNPKVREFVLPGSMLFTDEYHAYKRLGKTIYTHRRIKHAAKVYVDGDVHTQTIEGFWGHFKTDVRGTHHSISKRWLPGYLNEWVWKWNHRDDDEAMFSQLIAAAAA
jgi:transposase-like protein